MTRSTFYLPVFFINFYRGSQNLQEDFRIKLAERKVLLDFEEFLFLLVVFLLISSSELRIPGYESIKIYF